MLRTTLLMAAAVVGQAQNTAPVFEVASVKPSPVAAAATTVAGVKARGGPACPQTFTIDGSRVEIRCATVGTLILRAYRLPSRVTRPVGPEWIGAGGPKYDIIAKLPAGSTESQAPEMLQALLADRFKLVVHRISKEQDVLGLVAARGGLKLKEAATPQNNGDLDAPESSTVWVGGSQTRMTRGSSGYTIGNPRIGTVKQTSVSGSTVHWEAPDATLAGLADLIPLMGPLTEDVIDLSDHKGRYAFAFDISQDEAREAGRMSPEARGQPGAQQNAVQDMESAMVRTLNRELAKFGLQLEPRKGLVETMAVDRVEKPTEN